MKLQLNEETLTTYLNEAIKLELNEALNERGWFGAGRRSDRSRWWDPGTWGRTSSNEKAGYTWDKTQDDDYNERMRDYYLAHLRSMGYKSAAEYEAHTGKKYMGPNSQPQADNFEDEDGQGEDFGGYEEGGYPEEFPYQNDRQKIGQFQTWFNDNMGGKLAVDGIYGPKTAAAYQAWLQSVN
jgi:hypothetical protein